MAVLVFPPAPLGCSPPQPAAPVAAVPLSIGQDSRPFTSSAPLDQYIEEGHSVPSLFVDFYSSTSSIQWNVSSEAGEVDHDGVCFTEGERVVESLGFKWTPTAVDALITPYQERLDRLGDLKTKNKVIRAEIVQQFDTLYDPLS